MLVIQVAEWCVYHFCTHTCPKKRQEDAILALVDTEKLPIAPVANHRDMTARTMAIHTKGCEQVFKHGGKAIWKSLPIVELK